MLAESRGILTYKKPGFPSPFKIWSQAFPLMLSFQSRPLLYFLFTSWISPASTKHFLPLTHYSLLPCSAFSQLFVLKWRNSSNLISVSLSTSCSQLIKFLIYYQSPPNFPPASFFQSCIPWSSSPFCQDFHQLCISWSILVDGAPFCKPGLLSPGCLTAFCCLSAGKKITDGRRRRERNFLALT